MSLHEECGVFGVIAPEPCDVASISYYGLYALQHRGQESCGIVVNDDGVFVSHKDLGLVSEVFSQDILSRLPKGTMAVAHARYGTTGGTNRVGYSARTSFWTATASRKFSIHLSWVNPLPSLPTTSVS